jgi:hypothetical protein
MSWLDIFVLVGVGEIFQIYIESSSFLIAGLVFVEWIIFRMVELLVPRFYFQLDDEV